MSGLIAHEAAVLLPLLEGEDFEALKADIKVNGQLEPIRTLSGFILDGRNRYRACTELGVEPKLEEIDGPVDPAQFVLSANLYRRHLTESQRAMVAARLLEIEKTAAKARQREHGKTAPGKPKNRTLPANSPDVKGGDARERAGKRVKVGGRSVDHAAKVIAKGSQALIAAVDGGTISVSIAAKLAELSKEEQVVALKGGKEAVREAVKPKKRDPYYVSSAFLACLRDLQATFTMIHLDFGGSMAELMGSKHWDHAEDALVLDQVESLSRQLSIWAREARDFQGLCNDPTGGAVRPDQRDEGAISSEAGT